MNYLNKKKQLSCHVKKPYEGVLLINQDIYKIFIKNEQNFFFTFFHREIYFSGGRKEKRGGRKEKRGGRKEKRGGRKEERGGRKEKTTTLSSPPTLVA